MIAGVDRSEVVDELEVNNSVGIAGGLAVVVNNSGVTALMDGTVG